MYISRGMSPWGHSLLCKVRDTHPSFLHGKCISIPKSEEPVLSPLGLQGDSGEQEQPPLFPGVSAGDHVGGSSQTVDLALCRIISGSHHLIPRDKNLDKGKLVWLLFALSK